MGKNNRGKPKPNPKIVSNPVTSPTASQVVASSSGSSELKMGKEVLPSSSNPIADSIDVKSVTFEVSPSPVKTRHSFFDDEDLTSIIDKLRKEKEALALERDNMLIEKTREIEKLHSELRHSNFQLDGKTNELTVIHNHVREFEAHIEVSYKELKEQSNSSPLKSNGRNESSETESRDSDDHSRTLLSLIKVLSTMKAQVKSQSDQSSIIEKLIKEKELLTKQLQNQSEELLRSKVTIDDLHTGLKLLQTQFTQLEKENKKARQLLIELTESNNNSIDESKKQITQLTSEVNRLNVLVDQLELDKEQLQSEHKVSLEASLDDLELFRKELLDTINELNASYTQLATIEATHQQEIENLKNDMNNNEKQQLKRNTDLSDCVEQLEIEKTELVSELHRVMTSLNVSRSELLFTQQSLTDLQTKYNTASLSYQHELERLSGELTVSEAVLSALKADNTELANKNGRSEDIQNELLNLQQTKAKLLSDNQLLQHDLERLQLAQRDSQSLIDRLRNEIQGLTSKQDQLNDEISRLTFTNNHLTGEIQHNKSIHEREINTVNDNFKMIQAQYTQLQLHSDDLTALLNKANDALSSHLNDEALRIKNSERLVTILESSLDSKTKELEAMTLHCHNLELKLADLTDGKVGESVSSEEVNRLKSELQLVSHEVAILREKNNALTESNSKYLSVARSHHKLTIDTESQLTADMTNLNSHIVELNSTILNLRSQLSEAQQQLQAQSLLQTRDYSASAREAESKVAFTKESVRNHLLRNGVKCFHWEDLITLMKKVEVLHSQPTHSICYIADVIEVSNTSSSSHNVLNTSMQSEENSRGGNSAFKSITKRINNLSMEESHTLNASFTSVDNSRLTPSSKRSTSAQKSRQSSTTPTSESFQHYSFANHPLKPSAHPVVVAMRRPSSANKHSIDVSHRSEVDGDGHVSPSQSPKASSRRPSYNSESGSKHSTAAADNRKAWNIPGVHHDDPFGDVKESYRDVRAIHAGIEERFEFFKNQPASFFEYHGKHHDHPESEADVTTQHHHTSASGANKLFLSVDEKLDSSMNSQVNTSS